VAVREAALDVELWDAARRALAMAQTRRTAVRQLAVTVDRLVEANLQLISGRRRNRRGRCGCRTRQIRLGGYCSAGTARQVPLGRYDSAGEARQVRLGR